MVKVGVRFSMSVSRSSEQPLALPEQMLYNQFEDKATTNINDLWEHCGVVVRALDS